MSPTEDMTTTTTADPDAAATCSGKYLTFELADEGYGMEILKVREIIRMLEITPVPMTPPFIRGVVNLRGRVVPVMDLRTKFGMPRAEDGRSTCIIVVYVGQLEVGVVVDKVCEVLDIAESDVEDAPDFGASVDTGFLLGVGKTTGGRVTLLLDIDKALSGQEVEALSNL